MRALLIAFFASLLSMSLHAASGELSIFVIKDGKPLAKAKISIDGKTELITDKDGSAFLQLPIGKHQAVIDVKEEGKTIAFAKHSFIIAPNKNTEVILTLSETGKLENVDIEASQDAAKYADSNGTLEEDKRARAFLKGVIVSSEDKKPIPGARMFVKGSSSQAMTNSKGVFSLNVYDGNNTISIIHDKFTAKTLKIEAVAKKTVTQNIELSPAGMELEEFVVLKPTVEGSIASSIAEVRNSDTVGDVLGSEQFSKSGDSSAAGALKRVSGITLVGGKYVFIRGLGDRYSTIMFNDMYVPSPEPTKRVVPLDIFPTSVIGSIKIQKSYSSDIPGSFGGGAVVIRSKDIPDESFLKLEVSTEVTSDTGRSVVTNSDNSKGLPDSVILASENFREINDNKALTGDVANYRSFNHQQRTLLPGVKLSASAGDSFKNNAGWQFGYTGSVFYGTSEDVDDIQFNKYVYYDSAGTNVLDSVANKSVASFTTKYGGILSLALDSNKGTKAKYTMLYLNESSDSTTFGKTVYEGSIVDKDLTYYEYVVKNLFINQVNAETDIKFSNSTDGYFDNLVINIAGEYGIATRYEPGTVEYSYEYYEAEPFLSQKTWFLYSDLLDNVLNLRSDISLPFKFNGKDNYTQVGAFIYNKSRTLDNRRYKMQQYFGSNDVNVQTDIDNIFTQTNVDNGDIIFSSNYRSDDSYIATQNVMSVYFKQYLSILKDLDLVAGIRQEFSKQQLTDVFSGLPYDPLNTSDMLPALGLTYRLNDEMQLRAGYSITLSRPDFREFSPNRFKDPVTENIVFGNPNLLSTTINNLDIKYEWYPSAEESFSVAAFSKTFINPIEEINVIDLQSSLATQLVSFRNAESASSYGFEVDLRKRFGFIHKSLKNLLFVTNYSYINSQIKLRVDPTDEFLSNLTTTDRAMQGQSPYIINFQFGYDNSETGNSALFLFNEIGPRIVAIGTYNNEDEYEQPFQKLDFVAAFKLKTKRDTTYSLKFKASNILDSEVVIKKGDLITKTFKPGQAYNLSLNISF